VGVVGFADPLMLVILDEADASGDLGRGEEAERSEEVMIVTATAGEAGAEVTASHLDFDTPEDTFTCLRVSERRGIEAFERYTLTVSQAKSEPHPHSVHNCLVIMFRVAAEPNLAERHLRVREETTLVEKPEDSDALKVLMLIRLHRRSNLPV
jgi:hypothetical protein